MFKKLDFRSNGTLAPDQSRCLNQVADRIRPAYVEWIGELGSGNEANIDWWVSVLGCRDTATGSLFLHVCMVEMVVSLLRRGETIDLIEVDSKALFTNLQSCLRIFQVPTAIKYTQGIKYRLWDLIVPILHFLSCARYFIRSIVAAWRTREGRKEIPEHPFILDTFVLESSFSAGDYVDKYYQDIEQYLDEATRSKLVYLPTLYGITDYTAVVRKLRVNERKFLIKDDYLYWHDYVYALMFPWRIRALVPARACFMDLDMLPLVKDEIYSYRFHFASMLGCISYRFALRLKQQGVRPVRLINWFENQEIDKGLNAGFRRYLPDTTIIGYQGFINTKNYLHLYPSSYEYKNEVIPHFVTVMGEGWIDEVKRYCPELNVFIAPGMRYKNMFSESHVSGMVVDKIAVLVAFPYEIDEAMQLLTVLLRAYDLISSDTKDKISMWFKLHPADSGEWMSSWGPEIDSMECKFVDGDFSALLEQASLVVGNATGGCMEALAKGVSIIILGPMRGLTKNPIPDVTDSQLWKECYTAVEMADLIEQSTIIPEQRNVEKSRYILKRYFSEVKVNSVRSLFDMNPS